MFQWGMTVALDGMTRDERRELRKKLKEDLMTVQSLASKVEARELQLRQSQSAQVHPTDTTHFSGNDVKTSLDMERTPQLKIKPRVEILKQLSFSQGSPTGVELLRNKRTPKANQLYNKADFVVGKDKMPVFSRSRSKHKGSKKKALNGDRKRQRSAFRTDIRLQCKSVLNKLMSHRDGWIFNHPVDADKLGLTDYHFFIKSPMDLGTIRSKLDKKQYSAAQEFADDVRLTFSNAMTYNPPSNDVHGMAVELLSMFENGWEVIEERLKRIEAERELEMLSNQVQEANGASSGKADGYRAGKKGSTTCKSKPRIPSDPNDPTAVQRPKAKRRRVMTLQQKQELAKIMDQLPQQVVQDLISMMTERNVNMCRKGDEIEIDPDTFDNATLWELYRRAKSCLKRASKPKKTAAPKAKPAPKAVAEKTGFLAVAEEEDAVSDSSNDSDSSSNSDSDSDSDSNSDSDSERSSPGRNDADDLSVDKPQ